MDVVELLDSDDEKEVNKPDDKIETTEKTDEPEKINEEDPISTPLVPAEPAQTPVVKASPKNRPGPLSMKLKNGIPVDRNDINQVNRNESPVLSDDQDIRKKNKIITNLVDPCSKFLADFDPEHSIRERRKIQRKSYPVSSVVSRPGTLYDENGVHRESGLDYCDCLVLACPGCHFPCVECGSEKCGPACRVHRKFVYDLILFDGKDEEIKNPTSKYK